MVSAKGKLICEKVTDQIREDFGLSWSQNENVNGFNDFWESSGQIATVIKKVACNKCAVKISSHGRGLDVFFGKKAQNDAPAAESRGAESAERLNLLQRAFENDGLDSKVLKP